MDGYIGTLEIIDRRGRILDLIDVLIPDLNVPTWTAEQRDPRPASSGYGYNGELITVRILDGRHQGETACAAVSVAADQHLELAGLEPFSANDENLGL